MDHVVRIMKALRREMERLPVVVVVSSLVVSCNSRNDVCMIDDYESLVLATVQQPTVALWWKVDACC